MYINFNIYHSGGSSFVNINDCWLLQKLFIYYRYRFSSEKKNKESHYMVSHPETGSDSPIGSDRDRGRDNKCTQRAAAPTTSALGMHATTHVTTTPKVCARPGRGALCHEKLVQ